MSLIRPGDRLQRQGPEMWATVRDAQGDTGRTVRLCVILLVMSLATSAPVLIVALAHGWL
jgi:hypothetical protein